MPVAPVEQESAHAQYSIAGVYNEGSFVVRHVGLLARDCQLAPGAIAHVLDSGPPLRVGQDVGAEEPLVGEMTPALIGWADLDESQRRNIERVLADIRTRMPYRTLTPSDYLTHYVAVPHMDAVPGEVPGTVKHYRFSCAGLVFYCYEEGAGITLVDIERLPLVPFAELARIWPQLLANRPILKKKIGYPDELERQVLLPGYLFHALHRVAVTIPYVPSLEDRAFPRAS
jgi:hypothetical protein